MRTRSTKHREPARETRRLRNHSLKNQKRNSPAPQKPRRTVDANERIQDDLHKIYTNVKSIPSYSSKIAQFLRRNETSSLHKQIRKNFKRRRTIAYYPYDLCMVDLAFYNSPSFVHANGGNKYILVFIDVFTKMCYVESMKDKNAITTLLALENIFRRLPDIPKHIVTDDGTEFYNKYVNDFFEKNCVVHYSLRGRHKAAVAERMIKTMKGRLEKYFWQNKTKRYVDVLQQIIDNYNQTPHRSIGMAPILVNFDNRKEVFEKLYPNRQDKLPPRLKVGDKVRIAQEKTIFEKGYTRNWSIALYSIVSAESRGGVDYYKIEDQYGNILHRQRYYYELNLIEKDDN